MEKKMRHIIALDFIVIVGTLILIAGLVGYSRPLVISPLDDFVSRETGVLFSFEKADLILIDSNPEFTSPDKIYAENNLVINLKPGIYYWKLNGALSSEVRKLTIESEVDLKLKKSVEGTEEGYEVVNSGNTELNVDIYGSDEELIGNVILEIDKSEEVEGTKFIGSENE
jgi:hypothetical protein